MNGTAALNADGLRERNVPARACTEDDVRKVVLELNAHEERTQNDEQKRKTYGRTPEGIGQWAPNSHNFQEIYLSTL
jgi:hypothetical protein